MMRNRFCIVVDIYLYVFNLYYSFKQCLTISKQNIFNLTFNSLCIVLLLDMTQKNQFVRFNLNTLMLPQYFFLYIFFNEISKNYLTNFYQMIMNNLQYMSLNSLLLDSVKLFFDQIVYFNFVHIGFSGKITIYETQNSHFVCCNLVKHLYCVNYLFEELYNTIFMIALC